MKVGDWRSSVYTGCNNHGCTLRLNCHRQPSSHLQKNHCTRLDALAQIGDDFVYLNSILHPMKSDTTLLISRCYFHTTFKGF